MNTESILLEQCTDLLRDQGLPLSDHPSTLLHRFAELVQECNRAYGLVSQNDVDKLFGKHIVDALSLAPIIANATDSLLPLVDLGTGAGFPAVPLKILLPDLPLIIVERSSKKVGFLRRLIGPLNLENVTIHHGEFPHILPGDQPAAWITARAIERPATLLKCMHAFMGPATTFLCQWALPDEQLTPLFHVEHFADAWTEKGLRRGTLRLLRKRV